MIIVKEDCVLEDEIGIVIIYIWDLFFKNIKIGIIYEFENFSVKYF